MNERFPQGNPQYDPEQADVARHSQEPAPGEQEANHETALHPSPRIYVTAGLPLRADLTDGTWLDMAQEPGDIYEDLYTALGNPQESAVDRFYIWDHEDFGAFGVTTGALGLEGTDSIELLAQVARGIKEHGPAYALWASVHEDDPRLFDHFANSYKGHHASMGAYVQQLFEPLKIEDLLRQAAPEGLQDYVHLDYNGIGEEMEREGDIVAFLAEGGGVWVFDERA